MFNTGGYDFTSMLKSVNDIRSSCKEFTIIHLNNNPSGWLRLGNNISSCYVDIVRASDKEFSFAYKRVMENSKSLLNTDYEEVIRVNIGVDYKPFALIRTINGCIELRFITDDYHDVFCFVLNFERQSVSREQKHYSDSDLAKLCFRYSFELNGGDISYCNVMKNSIFNLSLE